MSNATTAPSAAIYDKLKTLGIELPPVSTPAAAYLPYVQTSNLIFLPAGKSSCAGWNT